LKESILLQLRQVYIENLVNKQVEKILNVSHRHIVFTIPKELRGIFYWNRDLLKELSNGAVQVVQDWYKSKSKLLGYEVGVIAVVHTFGGALGFNPHVHTLVTEGALDKFNRWKPVGFIPYEYLRKKWQWVLLKIVREKFKDDSKRLALVKWLYNHYSNGFYVHAKTRMKDARGAARYIGRYLARPAIAEYRIINYDGKTVRFWYIDHKTEKKTEAELPVLDFIGKLIMHIPKKHFRMIRRYGLYRRGKDDIAQKAVDSYNSSKLGISPPRRVSKKISNGSWRSRMINSFGRDPLKCPLCGHEMELYYVCHRRYGYIYRSWGSGKWRVPYEEKEKDFAMARRA